MSEQFSLGIDIGTSSVKATLLSSGHLADTARSAPYPTASPAPHHAEQDPGHWWAATGQAVGELLRRHPGVGAANTTVGLTGQMHTTVLRDESGRLLRSAVLWSDQRAADQCRRVAAAHPEVERITGNVLVPAFTLAHLLWLGENEPGTMARARRVLVPKDDLRLRLGAGFATEPSDASATALYDTTAGEWSGKLLALAGLERSMLPDCVDSTAVTGEIRAVPPGDTALERLVGAPVVAGAGDQAAQAVALGAVRPGRLALSLGTSGAALQALDAPRGGAFRHARARTWLALDSTHAAGLALTWWSKVTGVPVGDLLAAVADTPAPDPDVPLFLPFLQGHREGAGAPGAFVHLGAGHGRDDLTLAVLEGIAFEMRRLALSVGGGEIAGGPVHLGGGGGRSPRWQQVLAAVLDRPLSYSTRDSSCGAALLAAHAAGWGERLPDVEADISRAGADEVARHAERRMRYETLVRDLQS